MKISRLMGVLSKVMNESGDIDVWVQGFEGKIFPMEGTKLSVKENESFGVTKKKLVVEAHG